MAKLDTVAPVGLTRGWAVVLPVIVAPLRLSAVTVTLASSPPPAVAVKVRLVVPLPPL